MSKVIRTKAELNTHFKFDSTIEVSTIDNHLLTVEDDYILPIFGQTFFDEIVTAYESVSPTDKQKALILHTQQCITELAAWMAIDDFNVSFSASGLAVIHDKQNGVVPASKARTEKLKYSLHRRGLKSIDRTINYLEIYKSDFATWTDSSEYANSKTRFINTAADFNAFCGHNLSRFLFIKVQAFMDKVEEQSILKTTCQGLFDELKTQIAADTVTAENEIILRRIKFTVANLAFSNAILPLGIRVDGFGLTMFNNTGSGTHVGREQPENSLITEMIRRAETDGQHWLNNLSDYLKNNADTYPLYKASSCFVDITADEYTGPGVKAIEGGAIT